MPAVNLASLSPSSQESIISTLQSHHSSSKPYTRLASRGLVFVHPNKSLDLFNDSTSKEYALQTKIDKDSSTITAGRHEDAHVFDLAASAYYHLVRHEEDQSILLRGLTNTGKSLNAALITRALIDLSRSSKKKSRIQSAALKVDTVLNGFGNAWTSSSKNSSRFHKYSEFQFQNGRMVGLKTLEYLLEKHRITKLDENERCFHIFYYLMAGATPQEKSALHLTDPSQLKYLSHSKFKNVTVDDGLKFEELKEAMKAFGMGKRVQAQIWQLLSAILHLGNIIFVDDIERPQEACTIKNRDVLALVSDFLGLHPLNLESALTYKTKIVKREVCSVFLTAEEAALHRDALAETLYEAIFIYIVDQMNEKLCQDDDNWSNFIGVIDFAAGSSAMRKENNNLWDLLINYSNEKLQSLMSTFMFDIPSASFPSEGLPIPPTPPHDFTSTLSVISPRSPGVLYLVDEQTLRGGKDSRVMERIYKGHEPESAFVAREKSKTSFAVKHYFETVEYNVKGWTDRNAIVGGAGFENFFTGSGDLPPSNNTFVKGIFGERMQTSFLANNRLKRAPSVERKGQISKAPIGETVISQTNRALNELLETIEETQFWIVNCIKPTENESPGWDHDLVERQVSSLGIFALSCGGGAHWGEGIPFDRFIHSFLSLLPVEERNRSPEDAARYLISVWGSSYSIGMNDIKIGATRIYLTEDAWRKIDFEARKIEAIGMNTSGVSNQQQTRGFETASLKDGQGSDLTIQGDIGRTSEEGSVRHSYAEDDNKSFFSEGPSQFDDTESNYDSEYNFSIVGGMPRASNIEMSKLGLSKELGAKTAQMKDEEDQDDSMPMKKKKSPARKRWICCSYLFTFCFPPFCLRICGRMPRKDIQQAWREKVTLFILILFMCAVILFYIIVLGRLICPVQDVKSPGELTTFNTDSKPYVSLYGYVYKIDGILKDHVPTKADPGVFEEYILGTDVSDMFNRISTDSGWNSLCPGITRPPNAQWSEITRPVYQNKQEANWRSVAYHQSTVSGSTATIDYISLLASSKKGTLAIPQSYIDTALAASTKAFFVKAYDRVYDVSTYADANVPFLGENFDKILNTTYNNGQDVTYLFNNIKKTDRNFSFNINCFHNLFFKGIIDHRNDPKCQFSNWILLASSIVLVCVIGVKFLAALQLGSKRNPEDHDKFVICQVPCYTEGAESLTKTLESLALLRYDDKRKLLFVIADGMIIGSGNDRPTPRIVLDIIGVDPAIDPEPLPFLSLGEGIKQLNYGKVYSGLYEVQGRAVPYVVLVKVGAPTERSRPGNRGKRDSQMILMNFLSKVHFNQEMSPLELELYHQIKNVIGVHPSFYEYVLMVDADTEVLTDSLNRMVSVMINDSKIMGLCGETLLTNESDSWVTMIQVYEYFISHHLAKAFESLFGSVTCLPGCFCMYRVRTPTKNIPLLVAPGVIKDYSENDVDTLHKKNLLHLGEDRYLTTLMLKHFPNLKLSFTPDAKCKTNAPDRWAVLLSQRRRWINSTIHNLLELLFLPQLCGFCLFSMRFVVFIDLFATLVQPAIVVYLGYLIYSLTIENSVFPLISIIMLAAIYGLQIIIFILKREWQHIAWMIIYLLAIPVFAFYIPLYSFWHMDDFSWGNTRVVLGENGKRTLYVAEVEKFNPNSIPKKKWSDYEAELLDKQETASMSSYQSGQTGVSGSRLNFPQPGLDDSASAYGGSVIYPPSQYNSNRMSTAMSGYGVPPPAVVMPSPALHPNGTSLLDTNSIYNQQQQQRSSFVSGAMPTDDQILQEIRHILSTANLMTITKKQTRDDLSAFFGYDLTPKRDFINNCIDKILKGEL